MRRDAEVAGLALVGVPDRALAAGDGVDDAGGALGSLAALDGQSPLTADFQSSGAAFER